MKKWLKRIRGALGTALTWAAGWSVVGTILWWAGGLIFVGGTVAEPAALTATLLVTFGVFGFISGAIFSVVLGLAEGRRRFDQMSLPRFAAWGAVGGLLLTTFVVFVEWGQLSLEESIILGILPLMGAGSAAGSLALARESDDKDLLEAGDEATGLIETT